MSNKKSDIPMENAQRPLRDDELVPKTAPEQKIDLRVKLRREIVHHQGELEAAMSELRGVVEEKIEKVDIRRRIAADPWPWLAGGFAVGMILGLRGR